MAIGGIVAGAGSLLGAGLGYLSAEKDRAAQKKAIKKAMRELESLGVPPDLSKSIVVEELQRQGIYTPELQQEIDVAESEMGKITEDQSLRDAQKQALAMMQQRAQVGLGAEDRAALNEVRRQVQADAEAKRQQIMQTMAARGQAGGGADLMAQLQASQGAADQAAAGSDTIMAQAQQRALEALARSGQMAGDVRSQDFNVASARAQALDERNRFLAQNAVARQAANVQALNQAQQLNLAEQQRLHEANIAARRAEAERQVAEQGNLFDRKFDLASAKSSAQLGQAAAARQAAQDKQSMYTQIGSGLGKVGAGLYESGAFSSTPDAAGGTTGFSKDYLSGPDYFTTKK